MTLRLVAWEATGACNLACVHCRAEAKTEPDPGELETAEVRALIDSVAGLARQRPGPLIFIISGGEPLLRPDIYELAAYSAGAGLHTVVATNGTLLDDGVVRRLKEAGVRRLSVSLDGPDPASHDDFRGVPGAFDGAARGLAEARRQDLPFQINTTVTRRNVGLLPAMLARTIELGGVAWDVFMLVPTGRGVTEAGITAPEYERILGWVAETSATAPIDVKVTCGPHYARIWRQRAGGRATPSHGSHGHGPSSGPARAPGGCMAGDGFIFVSRSGQVFPCGYLPLAAGSVRERSFADIYASSPLFIELRDPARLGGKCGRCEFKEACHGCRARAYAFTGDYLASEPLCLWKPRATETDAAAASGAGAAGTPAAAAGAGLPAAAKGARPR